MKNLIIVLSVLMLAGCASRQKDVVKSAKKFKFESAIDTTAHFTAKLEARSELETIEQHSSSSTAIDYEGYAGDSLEVTEFGPGGAIISKTVIKGKGKANIRKGESSDKKQSSETAIVSEDTKLQASGNKNISGAGEELTKTKHKESSGPGFMTYIWIFLLVLIIIAIFVARWYINKGTGIFKA
jgi:uncharacterized protein YcfL